MNRNQFNQHVEQLLDGCKTILGTKGEDYSYADEDRLSNFKESAKEVGLTKYQVWYVYFNKGMSAIRRYVSKGKTESENIHARIQDAVNYLILLDAMITEDEPKPAYPALTPAYRDPPPSTHFPSRYRIQQEVTKQGIRCIVTYMRLDGLRWCYDLQAIESGNVFQNVPEAEIKPCGIKPPIS